MVRLTLLAFAVVFITACSSKPKYAVQNRIQPITQAPSIELASQAGSDDYFIVQPSHDISKPNPVINPLNAQNQQQPLDWQQLILLGLQQFKGNHYLTYEPDYQQHLQTNRNVQNSPLSAMMTSSHSLAQDLASALPNGLYQVIIPAHLTGYDLNKQQFLYEKSDSQTFSTASNPSLLAKNITVYFNNAENLPKLSFAPLQAERFLLNRNNQKKFHIRLTISNLNMITQEMFEGDIISAEFIDTNAQRLSSNDLEISQVFYSANL